MDAEKEILLNEAYQQFFQFGLGNLPIEMCESIVAENYMGYGTALDEKLFSAIDFRDMVVRQIEQAQGMDMKFAETPVFRRISVSEDVAIIVAEILIQIQVESSHHDLFLRMTTIMEYLNGKWIAVHSHGSKPENTSGDTDTWHIDEWKRKNEELQKLVDEKTADLAGKNQELVIEACLERVRSQALSMKVPEDMPEVCRIIAEQLIILGVKDIRNIQTAIFYPEKGTYLNFEYYCLYDKKLISEINFKLPEQESFANKMMNEPGAFLEEHFSGKELSDWLAYQEKTNQFVDLHLYTTESVSYYFYSLGPVSLGISTYAHLKPGDLDLMKRFRNVFELAYTRFLDIQQAESRAREAMIELTLERVRARTMAMQKSNELPEAANLLFHQMQTLGMPAWSAGYCIWDDDKQGVTLWMSSEGVIQPPFHAPLTVDPTFIHMREAFERGETLHVEPVGGEELKIHYRYMRTLPVVGEILDSIIDAGHPLPVFQIMHCAYFSQGFLLFITYEPMPQAWDIFKRFSNVFDQTYTRFLDLQKAEAQARNSHIEAALEKVRSASLAMHKAEELKNVVAVVFQKLKDLRLTFDVAGIQLYLEGSKDIVQWVAAPDLLAAPILAKLPFVEKDFRESEIVRDYWAAKEMGKSFSNKSYSFDEKNKFFEYAGRYNDFTAIPEDVREFQLKAPGYTQTLVAEKRSAVWVDSYSNQTIPSEGFDILKRFARIFEQAYIRFLDLQKAETQAREGQIELALERVRARTMAMQKSDELREVVAAIYEQLQHLGFTYGACSIVIMDKISGDMIWWISGFEKPYPESYYIPFFDHPFYLAQLNNWKEGKKYAVLEASGEVKKSYDEIIFSQTEFVHIPEETRKVMMAFEKIYFSNAYMKHGALSWSVEPLSDEHAKILQRFAIVFEQTYTRFLDLQKAEAQARDAQIELALERVRAKTMAMQNSSELREIVGVIYDQLQHLGFTYGACAIVIMEKSTGDSIWWMAGFGKEKYPESYKVPFLDHPFYREQLSYLNSAKSFVSISVSGEEKKWYDELIFSLTEFRRIPEETQKIMCSLETIVFSNAYMKYGALSWGTMSISDEYAVILQRFAIVFEQTYTRFLDLQKAETQAREAQIESALEKVRSRTMAMQKSDELADAAYVLFQQLNHLGVIHERINIGIVKEETQTIDFWITEQGGNQINTRFSASLNELTTISKVYAAWKSGQKSMVVDLAGEDLKAWLKYLTEVIGIPFDPAFMHNRRVQTAGFFSKGMLVLTTPEPVPEESVHLLEKFAGVFDLTYTRFNDLLLAEAQTHKANIEVALERVRARALAMQEPEELIEVAEVLRHEMGLLGVEELETSSIYLHDDNSETVECWYAISDLRHPEKKLVADQINIDLQKTWVGRQMFDFYQSDKTQISILMQGENRIEWIKYCASVSTVFGDFYGESIPDRTYHLYKFSNGAIGAASAGDISTESWELLSRTASVFSLAYSRFKDLTKARIDLQRLKEEKQRAELALTDLKAAQTQLVQAEKMASLGELTAGIAHEIQNPLNFVNNFSDLSNELLEEMQEEMEKGNSEEVKLIVADIRNNLEKINLHGKRADSIVKGMLQHSRTTSGEKQPTDINALAEEYFRLAYHGLRAKDKNFNATLKSEFDSGIGKINVLPQDIGRVLLNLINNAFYAVNERSKESVKGYEPEVSISTHLLTASENSLIRQSANSIIISVKDNGNGIPQKVLDKIFQPFFTTKPTGQGTGLGLSLSYDIVKTHGGEIKVNSKEGDGTEFIIQLPIV